MKFRLQKDFLKCVSNSHTCVALSSPIHLELKHTLPLFPWKPYLIPARKRTKTIPFGAAHIYMAYIRDYPPPYPSGVFPSTSSLFQLTLSTYKTVRTTLKVPFQWGYPIKSWKVGILFYIIKWKQGWSWPCFDTTLSSLLCTVNHVVHMPSSIVALMFYYYFYHWYTLNIYTKLRKRWGKGAQGSQ